MNVNQTKFKPFEMTKLVPSLDRYCSSENDSSTNFYCRNLRTVLFCYANKANLGNDNFFCKKCDNILNPNSMFYGIDNIFYHINRLMEFEETAETIITSCNEFRQACSDLETDLDPVN